MPVNPSVARGGRIVGRAELLATLERTLAGGTNVLLTGPNGIGKSTVLDAVMAAAASRGERTIRIDSTETERWLPYSGLTDLLAQIPPEAIRALPEPQRAALDSVLYRAEESLPRARTELACRVACRALLDWCARLGPVLLILDDVQWLDASSAGIIEYATRRLTEWSGGAASRSHRLRTIATQPRPGRCPLAKPVIELAVPPMDAHDLSELLEAHGLPCRAASRLRGESGGNPYLALALSGAFANRDAPTWYPISLPERVASGLNSRIALLPAAVRETLFLAALAAQPTIELLRLAGRGNAEHDLYLAAAAGLIVLDGTAVRFTPAAVASLLASGANEADRARAHTLLATVSPDPTERARHRAMTGTQSDAEAARSLVAAAEAARKRGARSLVAELYLLAADRSFPDLPSERLDWLVAAAEAGVGQPQSGLTARAAEAVLLTDAPAAYRVRARLALIDLAGQSIGEMHEVFAAALHDAGDDPALLAPLRLRLAWQAMVANRPVEATRESDLAVALADQAGDVTTAAMARATQAHLQRGAGVPEYSRTLAAALAGPKPPLAGWLHLTPQYLSARFDLFDDKLEAAWSSLLRMLTVAQRGSAEELTEVLHSLAQVSARMGRCRQAMEYASRSAVVIEAAGLSPGPAWYSSAVAELVGGSLSRALACARRGVRASEQEHDSIYLRRCLHTLGQALLRTGDPRGAVDALERLADLEAEFGATDPSVLRWHADLVNGLVQLGDHSRAWSLVSATRHRAAELGRSPGLLAELDRATALVLAARGDATVAAGLARTAAYRFSSLGQPIEEGHSLMVVGSIERRRRRFASARTALTEAYELFERVGARPWREQARSALARIDTRPDEPAGQPDVASTLSGLTATEARIASMVRQGATNREIASQISISVKTVEANLTRIYRKLGVRSRTQLSIRIGQVG